MSATRKKLDQAVRDLAVINGLYSSEDLAKYVALRDVRGDLTGGRPDLIDINSPEETEIMKVFLDATDGAYTIEDLVSRLSEVASNDIELRQRMNKVFEIFHTSKTQMEYYRDATISTILDVLGYGSGGSGTSVINSGPPSKYTPNLSVILSNTHRVALSNKNVNPCILFFNSIPNVEISRSTPFVDAKIYISKPPINERTKQLQTLSLPRFLLGAQRVEDDSTLEHMVRGSTISGQEASQNPQSDIYSVAGMEIFTSPQTLVNADSSNSKTVRANPILDKFQPFLTLNSISINAVPSGGAMSYKSGVIEMTLHDRSRLTEVADFIRPDLYGTNEIMLEYGWIHPDGESSSVIRNPYGDLINGLRVREKYMVYNSSFSMTETGKVSITLQIAMRGSTELSTEIISSDSESTNSVLKEIENLQSLVAECRARAFGNDQGYQTKEIRGIQILDAAQDAIRYTNFSSDLREALAEFKSSMSKSSNPSVQKLIDAIDQMYGEVSKRRRGYEATGKTSDGKETLQTQLRKSIITSMQEKLAKLSSGEDPFYIMAPGRSGINKNIGFRNVEPETKKSEQRKFDEASSLYVPANGFSAGSSSLAKILLHFVGEPLANTMKFDDIQFVFYPFNGYAGYASQINIGNFVVDNEFFAESFVRWRLETIGRSANLSLRDFMNFLISTVVEDPAAPSYGLRDDSGSLFKRVLIDDGKTIGTEAVDDPVSHNDRINKILHGVTPDGSFKMPRLEFYLECVPRKKPLVDGERSDVVRNEDGGATILRVHIYDAQASSYDTVGSLLANARDSEIASVGRVPNAPPVRAGESATMGNPEVIKSRERLNSQFLSAAKSYNLITEVPNSDEGTEDGSVSTWRITGGTERLKDFLYRTIPYIIYGAAGTTVLNANLSSMQDAALSTVNLLRSFNRTELEPNGENPGGLPMRIIPTELNVTTLGCPMVDMFQQYFVDFNTGTTADNIYAVTGVSHKLMPGSFTTDIKFAPLDAFGKYESIISRARTAQTILEDIEKERKAGKINF